MLIDLQVHSTYSDGYINPTKLVELISKVGVKVAALTDHNTVAGLNEFRSACRRKNIKPICGLELYVKLNSRKLNLLWYNFDDANRELHTLLKESQIRRRASVRRILERLDDSGFKFDSNKILDKYNHYVPINHIVGDIMEYPKNFNKIKKELSVKNPREEEIIHHYFSNDEIGHLRESYINIERVFKLRKIIGGQLILCHPAKYSYVNYDILFKLKNLGLDGIELLSPHHSYNAIVHLQQMAKDLGFITTGGSDFHRLEGGSNLIEKSWEYFKIDSKFLCGINKIIG